MATRVPARLTTGELRKFAFTVGAAFIAIAAISLLRGHTATPRIVGAVGGTLLLAGLLIPSRLGGLYRAWMALGELLSKVTTPLFMGGVYFLVLTPIGFLKRAFGSSTLSGPNGTSYWFERAPGAARRGNLERQY
jgi:hypothetical protein